MIGKNRISTPRKFSKRLGQNFLKDKNILRYESKLSNPQAKVVLEIGAGDGRLTMEILNLNPKKLYAAEVDKRWIEKLEKINDKRLIILFEDITKIDIPDDVEIVIGNIPYYLSSKIIFMLPKYNLERAVLMIQREFGEKMTAKPNEKNYGRLSVTSQIFFNVKKRKIVPKHLFVPQPKVDSIIMELKPRDVKLGNMEENIIRKLFSHKNKKIRSTFKDVSEKWAGVRPRTMTPKDVLDFIQDYSIK